MAMTVLCSQAAADMIAERQRTADRDPAVARDDLDALLGLVRICLYAVDSGSLAERRDAMVRAGAWLMLAAEQADREAEAQIREGVA